MYSMHTHCNIVQELLFAEKGALELQLFESQAALQSTEQQLSQLTQQHTATQAELAEGLDYQQQIESQLNELEMEAQAAKASLTAEQVKHQSLQTSARYVSRKTMRLKLTTATMRVTVSTYIQRAQGTERQDVAPSV